MNVGYIKNKKMWQKLKHTPYKTIQKYREM